VNAPVQTSGLAIVNAESPAQIAQVSELFLEYANSLGFSLCFQGFDKELAALPGDYAPPDGRLLLAEFAGQVAGCGALHRLDAGNCEIKRLYLRPQFRGHRIGRLLTERLIAEARAIGYRAMRLDTIADKMADAVALYKRLGFREIAPYRENPIPSALYMELTL
jgi:ribosomal protein S18 acetylase RimI-like enzyme